MPESELNKRPPDQERTEIIPRPDFSEAKPAIVEKPATLLALEKRRAEVASKLDKYRDRMSIVPVREGGTREKYKAVYRDKEAQDLASELNRVEAQRQELELILEEKAEAARRGQEKEEVREESHPEKIFDRDKLHQEIEEADTLR